MNQHREHIRNRMMKTAAAVWGYPGAEAETAFDPVVAMLINACAAETEKVARAAQVSQYRLMEKLAQLLTPDADSGAVPAHAIASAAPVETMDTVTEKQQLVYVNRIKTNDKETGEEEPFYFTPSAAFSVAAANVRYVMAKDALFEILDNRYRKLYTEALPGKSIERSVLYLGVEMPAASVQVHELRFFFDIRSKDELFYHYLRSAVWSLEGEPLLAEEGYGKPVSGEHPDADEMLKQKSIAALRTNRSVNRLYKKQFVTLKQLNISAAQCRKYPTAAAGVFPQRDLDKLEGNLAWFRVQFYEGLPDDVLKEPVCYTNCFPVINRRHYAFSFRLQKGFNIVPLHTKEMFFDLQSVTDSEGQRLHERFTGAGEPDYELLLRQGGVGRFNERDASEIIMDLLEALRDESVAFSRLGLDSITQHLLDLNRNIAVLQEKASHIPVKDAAAYLLIKSKQPQRNIFIECWSTTGETANRIRQGTTLESIAGCDLVPQSILLVTPVTGGRNRLTAEDRMHAYRKALLTKDKIITEQDIRITAFHCFGNKITGVNVKKGVMHSTVSPQAGLIKTIDVELLAAADQPMGEEEQRFLLADLQAQLEAGSANIFPFRVRLKETPIV